MHAVLQATSNSENFIEEEIAYFACRHQSLVESGSMALKYRVE